MKGMFLGVWGRSWVCGRISEKAVLKEQRRRWYHDRVHRKAQKARVGAGQDVSREPQA